MTAMPSDPVVVVIAVSAALMVFSLILLGGVRLVRLLGLPQDLPEGPRFEPPPPPLLAVADRAQAQAVRANQVHHHARFAQARSAWEAACAAYAIAEVHPGATVAATKAEAAAKAAESAARAGDAPAVAAHLATAQEACADARRHAG
jgi:hypothetical protein